jgi:hypothetical protein
LEVCFGVTSCEPQLTVRRIAKARIPTPIDATLLVVPMATRSAGAGVAGAWTA